MLFLFYEDLKADIMKELGRINEFLGTGFNQETLEAVSIVPPSGCDKKLIGS